MQRDIPDSIAIAGIYGFIGSKIYNAAVELGIRKIYGLDPGKPEDDFPSSSALEMVSDQERFYDLDAQLFHLALHPNHRDPIYHLIERGCHITCEKPMAHPEQPEECQKVLDALKRSHATLLYDFLELYNPMTKAVSDYLVQNSSRITQMMFMNSKDREDPNIPRNRKKMVPVQYQEAVHLLAYMLHQIGRTRGNDFELNDLLNDRLVLMATSDIYHPMNPEDYAYAVDGLVDGHIVVGRTGVSMIVNFKRNAPWTKWKVIQGTNGDGRTFRIEADYQIGKEFLRINDSVIGFDEDTDLYRNVIRKGWEWHTDGFDPMAPDATFAYWNFGLAAALWASSFRRDLVELRSPDDLEKITREFPNALQQGKFEKYPIN